MVFSCQVLASWHDGCPPASRRLLYYPWQNDHGEPKSDTVLDLLSVAWPPALEGAFRRVTPGDQSRASYRRASMMAPKDPALRLSFPRGMTQVPLSRLPE